MDYNSVGSWLPQAVLVSSQSSAIKAWKSRSANRNQAGKVKLKPGMCGQGFQLCSAVWGPAQSRIAAAGMLQTRAWATGAWTQPPVLSGAFKSRLFCCQTPLPGLWEAACKLKPRCPCGTHSLFFSLQAFGVMGWKRAWIQ